MTAPLNVRNALAAARYPAEWAAWSGVKGEQARRRRLKLRLQAEHDAEIERLRAAGSKCFNCAYYRTCIPTNGWAGMGPWCDYHTDNRGYQTAQAEGLCRSWMEIVP